MFRFSNFRWKLSLREELRTEKEGRERRLDRSDLPLYYRVNSVCSVQFDVEETVH